MKQSHYFKALAGMTAGILLLTSGCKLATILQPSDTQSRATATGPRTFLAKTPAQTESKGADAATNQAPTTTPAQVDDNTYDTYTSQTTLTGYLRSIGSDSMDKVMEAWDAEFSKSHHTLRFRQEGKGSSTAIPALLENRADFGPMSRRVKDAEIAQFKAKFGYAPTQLPVAIDALAVYIHPDNPILKSSLSLEQLKAIFGSAKALNGNQALTRWGQLGLTGKWANAPIRLHGRNPASGTYAFFNATVLGKGGFSERIQEHAGSASVVEAISTDPYAIGYSGIAYATEQVRTAPLKNESGQLVEANKTNAIDGSYPITRKLFITINLDPQTQATALQKEFIRFAYSKAGQDIVAKVGYFPVDPKLARETSQRFQ